MKNFSKAVYHYTKVLEIGFMDKETSNGIRINLAISLYKIGDYQKALDDLTKISPKGDNKHREILLLSAINIKLNKIDEAIELLQKALSQNPKKPSILYQLGSLYHRENDQKYILYFDKLFDIASRRKKIPSKYLQSFALLARGHFEKKHYDRVIEIAEFLGKERMNGDIKLIFAKSSYYKGSYETAAQLFEESNLAGDDKLLMCKTYIRLGKTDRAKSALIDYINNTSDSASRIKTDQELKTLYNTIESQNRQTAP
jgi:tetratricopeptide (TPR) repeat protein